MSCGQSSWLGCSLLHPDSKVCLQTSSPMSRYETHAKGQRGFSSKKNSKDFYIILKVIQKRTCNLNKLHLQRNALNRGCIVKVHFVAALRRPKFTSFKFLCICLHQKKKKEEEKGRRIHTTCCTCLIPFRCPLFLACLPTSCRHACPSTCWAGHGCLPSTQRAGSTAQNPGLWDKRTLCYFFQTSRRCSLDAAVLGTYVGIYKTFCPFMRTIGPWTWSGKPNRESEINTGSLNLLRVVLITLRDGYF